jgi:hypothetical protein
MTEHVSLEDLLGEGVLDAVDMYVESRKQYGSHYEDCQMVSFRLNDKVYVAIEDPSDGYRSCLEDLFVSTDPVTNVFPAVRVIGRMKEHSHYGQNEILELVDAVTGGVVLEVGTENSDDYYPGFVGSFSPENMATNAAALSNGE